MTNIIFGIETSTSGALSGRDVVADLISEGDALGYDVWPLRGDIAGY